MFSLTTRSRYGVAAVLDLVENRANGLVQIKDIVRRKSIPKNYLEQIFNRLTRAGIVKSVRGNRGGYELAANPSEISLLSLLQALDGNISISDGEELLAVKALYEEIENASRGILDISLAEVASRQQKFAGQAMYHI